MSYGIHRELLELSLGAFNVRYGGGLSEKEYNELRTKVPSIQGSYVLMANNVEVPNSSATIYSDSTKVITQIDIYNYTPDTIAAFSFGSGRFLYVPFGAFVSIPMADHFGLQGYDAGCDGTAQCQVIVYGYQPSLQIT